MIGDSDKDKRGFSRLSDLASEISSIDEPVRTAPKAEAKTSTTQQPTQPQRKSSSSKPEPKATSSPPPIETVSTGKSGGSSGGKWIFGIISIVFVIWLINNGEQGNKKPSYNPPSQLKSDNYPQSSSAPAVQTPGVPQSSELQYTRPSIGTNNLLSVPEICWCLREVIRIEAMRDVIDTNEGINEFNRIVNDYNSRCSSYRYHQGAQQRAEREVENYRSQIVAEAIREARQLGRSYQPSHPSISPGISTNSVPKKPSAQYTREAQQLLVDLGYDPGPVDGKYGRLTANAVKAFQRDVGIPQDGWIDKNLLNILRKAKATYKPSHTTPSAIPSQKSQQPETTPSMTSKVAGGYFTRGSHQDDVLRVQGTPDDINIYSASGYEKWKYGYSSIQISSRNRRVLSWVN